MENPSEHADGEQAVSQTRQEIIEAIVTAARPPCPKIVKRSAAIGTNGEHYTCGFPVGVEDTGERYEYYVFQSPEGPTYGRQFDSPDKLEADYIARQDRNDAELRGRLVILSDAKLQEQSDYWASQG